MLGKFLREQMSEKGITVPQMARAAGITPDTMLRILRGEIGRPPDERLRAFARVLRIPFSRLERFFDSEDKVNRAARAQRRQRSEHQ